MDELRELLVATAHRAADHREQVDEHSVFPVVDVNAVTAALGTLHDHPTPAADAVAQLADAVEPHLVGSSGSRYFGFVIGGSLDAAVAADMLAVAWDQNAYNSLSSPIAAIVEQVCGTWLKELLGLPATASFGFVTGAQGANTVGLAAGRHHVLAAAGWDVERDGLAGGPRIRVVTGDERHATIDRAVRLLGLGANSVEPVAVDAMGAIDTDDLERVLAASTAPTIVCLQAGNVNTGAIDPLGTAADIAHRHGAWVHIDGAFGLWAVASDSLRHLTAGIERADSWGVDGHKWLNVPYDCGYVFCAHPQAHAASVAYTASYLVGQGSDALRSPGDYVLDSSRRARGFATWAALRQLGRSGVQDLIDRCCRLARLFAERLDAVDGITVMNDVMLNQVLVGFGDDATTDRVIAATQASGECWMGGTTWHGQRLMRISVSSWRTDDSDVERSVAAIVKAFDEVRAS